MWWIVGITVIALFLLIYFLPIPMIEVLCEIVEALAEHFFQD